MEDFFRTLVASEEGKIKPDVSYDDPPKFNYPIDYVVRTWMNFYRHGIYPEAGAYNDQDPRLMDDWHTMNLYHIRIENGVSSAFEVPMSEQAISLDELMGG